MRLFRVMMLPVAALLVAVSVGDRSEAQPSFPDGEAKIRIWSNGWVPIGRGQIETRLEALFWDFGGHDGVSDLTVYTSFGKFVFEGSHDDIMEIFGTASEVSMGQLEDDEFLIFKATGTVDGRLYDLTANLQPSEPISRPYRIRFYRGGAVPQPFSCVPGKTDRQIFEAVYLGLTEDWESVILRIDSGEELRIPIMDGIEHFRFGEGEHGSRVLAFMKLTHSANDSGECVTSTDGVAISFLPD
jgi:hypothetical protein